MKPCHLGYVLSDVESAAGNCRAPHCGCPGCNCVLCKGTGVADLPDPWGGVRGTCPDCHGTGNGPADPCPQCERGGVCSAVECGRKRSSELMQLYGTPSCPAPDCDCEPGWCRERVPTGPGTRGVSGGHSETKRGKTPMPPGGKTE